MSRADGKLYELLADEVCRRMLVALLENSERLTQRELISALGYNSSTVSRRMGDLEAAGLVSRSSSHAPYEVVFAEKTRELLLAALDLAEMAHSSLAEEAGKGARKLRKDQMVARSPQFQAGDPA
jgi:DNA-binding MarR family transcriptional regulator